MRVREELLYQSKTTQKSDLQFVQTTTKRHVTNLTLTFPLIGHYMWHKLRSVSALVVCRWPLELQMKTRNHVRVKCKVSAVFQLHWKSGARVRVTRLLVLWAVSVARLAPNCDHQHSNCHPQTQSEGTLIHSTCPARVTSVLSPSQWHVWPR